MTTSSNGSIFRVTGTLWGVSNGQRWILVTKASDAGFDVFSEIIEQTMELPVFWDAMMSMWRHWNAVGIDSEQGTVSISEKQSYSKIS